MKFNEWNKRGVSKGTVDTGDLVTLFVQELGLPTRLCEVDVTDQATIRKIAEFTLKDVRSKTSCGKLETKEDVLEILKTAG
jgi:alcohol dehydrogenase class IV